MSRLVSRADARQIAEATHDCAERALIWRARAKDAQAALRVAHGLLRHRAGTSTPEGEAFKVLDASLANQDRIAA